MALLDWRLREKIIDYAADFDVIEVVEALDLRIETVGVRRSFFDRRISCGNIGGLGHADILLALSRSDMLGIFLQAQTDQPPDFTSSVSPLSVVPAAISKLCEILSERAFELFGKLVAVNDLSLCITYPLSPFTESPFGLCLTLMEDSIPYVLVELTSPEARKPLSVRTEESLKRLFPIDVEIRWNPVFWRNSWHISKSGNFRRECRRKPIAVRLNRFDEQCTEGHHREAVTLDIARCTLEVPDRSEESFLVALPQELNKAVFVFPSKAGADSGHRPVGR